MLYVENADNTFQQAIDAGATQIAAVEDMFWGDRAGRVADPHGYVWMIAQRGLKSSAARCAAHMGHLDRSTLLLTDCAN